MPKRTRLKPGSFCSVKYNVVETMMASKRKQTRLEARADRLENAFQLAWSAALEDGLITASNVLQAPRQILRAVYLAADKTDGDAEAVAELAFAGWRAAIVNFRNAQPATTAIH